MTEQNQSSMARIRQVLGTALVLGLLLPVPAYALSFAGNTWVVTTESPLNGTLLLPFGGNGGGALPAVGQQYTVGTTSGSLVDFLTTNTTSGIVYNGTFAIQSQNVTAANLDVIKGQLSGLSNFTMNNQSGNGSWTVQVAITNPSNNMFNQTYTNTAQPPNSASMTPQTLTGNPTITITFTFNNAKLQEIHATSDIFVSFSP
jgi:hypothetical protein